MNNIGLDKKKTKKLAENLNLLLADYQVLYANVRGFHWNIKGQKFFELHLKFEELYNDLQLKIDQIAERILTLGETPEHAFSSYLKHAGIKEAKNTGNGEQSVKFILSALETLLVKQRQILQLSDEAKDEGTGALMSDYIREQEKLVWMYSAFMG
jgi:starvation-inducible DNA-binding protein